MKMNKLIPTLVLLAQLLMACSANESMNKTVQNGGTILLSLGAYEEMGHVNLSKTNITAMLTDSIGTQVQITVREVFPLNADRTSEINRLMLGPIEGSSGFWFAAMDLIDKNTGLPTNLQPGNATLRITGLAAIQNHAIEILSGQGTVNPIMSIGGLNFLHMLRPATQVKYVASDPQNIFNEQNMLGVLEFQFEYPSASVAGLPPSKWPRAVSASNDDNLQLLSFTRSDNGTNTLHVVAINPAGIAQIATANIDTPAFYKASSIRDVRFSVVYPPEVGAGPFATPSARIGFDIDGEDANIDALVMTIPAI